MMTRLAYSIDEAAAASSLPRTAIQRAIHSGELRATRKGRRWVITLKALEDYLSTDAPTP